MSRIHLTLPAALFAANAFAIGELPPVNPAKTVSALDLYGVEPAYVPKFANTTPEPPRTASRETRDASRELLIPRKPAVDLWSNSGEAPLRMPDESEYSVASSSDFFLPEETLDDEPKRFFAASRVVAPAKVRVQPVQNSVGRAKKNVDVVVRGNDSGEDSPRKKNVVPAAKSAPSVIKSAPRFVPVKKTPAPNAENMASLDDEFAYKGEVPLTKLSPSQLKKAFKKTFTSENKHLSTYQVDDGFDEASFSESTVGFDSSRDLSEGGGVRPLEIKIAFNDDDSALSRDNYNLLAEYAGIVAANPKRAVQVSISERGTRTYDGRKLAARRLAIIEQVLKDSGIIDRRIIPVLSQRNDDSFVLRVISSDTFQTLSEKKRDMFGDTVSAKTYKSMSW
ncbi:MAG: hypothetical protein LBT45_00900 [Rickettsiales bacterium]|nr:hypothetical protein [Rickettsiales bacterium]